ncbi:hypothetical protein Q8F55_006048 [Vanrija albida]|uniref:Chitin-binding type-2 domain-containing protein n=1 Tax=Vanrija albida TaxID=181172 RepID=A0ABR3Q381_9TREE
MDKKLSKKFNLAHPAFVDHMDHYLMVPIPYTACQTRHCFEPRCHSIEFDEEYDVCAYHHFMRCEHCIGTAGRPDDAVLPPHGLSLPKEGSE